jgi:pSer/pThr/pTyr-binding forkhead associated (FHA) protein
MGDLAARTWRWRGPESGSEPKSLLELPLDVNDPTLTNFLAACGSKEPLRYGVGPREQMELDVRSFSQPFLVIGRSADTDLVLDHWQVSRRHAYLQLIEGRYYCVDLGSRTGTHGGDAAKRSGWLQQGRVIQIGPYAVRPEWPANVIRPAKRPSGLTWELPGGAVGQTSWRMDQYMAMIGRSPACKIRFLEPDISKFHCSVVLTRHGLWVIDLLGDTGIYVNDEKIRCARIEEGDELRVGSHILRARYDHPPLPLPLTVARPKSERAGTPAIPEIFTDAAANAIRDSLPARVAMTPMINGTELATILEKSGGAIDPSVNLLVHQFGMMQQNMLDQFHNTMMMMFEGFASLHREQASTIREEFEHVRKLSAEIEALRAETARLAKEAAAKPAPTPRPMPTPRPDFPGKANGNPGPAPRPFIPKPQLAGDALKKVNPGPHQPEGDIHAQLCLKLSNIETERQNRWQKILGMMSKA